MSLACRILWLGLAVKPLSRLRSITGLMFVASALVLLNACVIDRRYDLLPTQSARYVGQSGKNGEYAAYQLAIAGADVDAEFLIGEYGQRMLVLSDSAGSKSQAYVLPSKKNDKTAPATPKMQTVTYEVIWNHPNGAQFLAVKIDGKVFGFILIQADGTFQYSTAAK